MNTLLSNRDFEMLIVYICQLSKTNSLSYLLAKLSFRSVLTIHLQTIMEYSYEQRIVIVKTFYENKGSIEETIAKLTDIFDPDGIIVPEEDDITFLVHIFEENGSIRDEDDDDLWGYSHPLDVSHLSSSEEEEFSEAEKSKSTSEDDDADDSNDVKNDVGGSDDNQSR